MSGCTSCGGCAQCGRVPGDAGPPPGDPGGDPSGGPRRPPFKLVSKRVTYGTSASNLDMVVVSLPRAAAFDVFVRYRDDSGNTESPFLGAEQWKVFANVGQMRVQVGGTRTTSQTSTGNVEGIVARQLFAVRDLTAESFDLVLNGGAIAAGNTLFFDVTIICWGDQPTGIGPFQLQTFMSGEGPPDVPDGFSGLLVLGRDQAAGGDVWHSLTLNQYGVQDPSATSDEGLTNLNVLPVGQYRSAAPTLTNLQLLPLQVDANGNLKVAVTSSSATSSKFTSSAYEASHASSGAKTVRSIYVSSKAAAAGFVFIFDAASLPANGTVPDFPPVPIPAGPAFVSVPIDEGRSHATGLVVAFSSTQATLTIGTADCWFEAHW